MDKKLVKLRGRRIFPQRTSFQRVSSAPRRGKSNSGIQGSQAPSFALPASFLPPKLQGVLFPSSPAPAGCLQNSKNNLGTRMDRGACPGRNEPIPTQLSLFQLDATLVCTLAPADPSRPRVYRRGKVVDGAFMSRHRMLAVSGVAHHKLNLQSRVPDFRSVAKIKTDILSTAITSNCNCSVVSRLRRAANHPTPPHLRTVPLPRRRQLPVCKFLVRFEGQLTPPVPPQPATQLHDHDAAGPLQPANASTPHGRIHGIRGSSRKH